MSAILLRPYITIDSPGTRDGRPFYWVIYHLDIDDEDILWSGTSYASAIAVAEQWRQDDGVPVFDKVGVAT